MNAVNEHKKFGMAIEKWRVLMLAAFAVLAAGGFFMFVYSIHNQKSYSNFSG